MPHTIDRKERRTTKHNDDDTHKNEDSLSWDLHRNWESMCSSSKVLGVKRSKVSSSSVVGLFVPSKQRLRCSLVFLLLICWEKLFRCPASLSPKGWLSLSMNKFLRSKKLVWLTYNLWLIMLLLSSRVQSPSQINKTLGYPCLYHFHVFHRDLQSLIYIWYSPCDPNNNNMWYVLIIRDHQQRSQ